MSDPDKQPIAGAKVLILRGDAVSAEATTGVDGQYGPVVLTPGEYRVEAVAPGLSVAPKAVSLKTGTTAELDIALAISAVQESVVVSAARETTLSRTTDSVTVIDRAELDTTQTATVADALRHVPGFHVASSGGFGAITSLFPRGGESDYTLVLVDGVPQNSFGGGFDAAHLDTAGLDRVEVVRGPKSALYGNGAIGGIVQLVSRQGGPTRGDFAVEGGGYGYSRTTGSASGSSGAWRWGGSFDRLMSDGDQRTFAKIGQVSNDNYDRAVGSGSVGWSDRSTRSVRVDVRGERDDRGFPGPFGSDPASLYGGIDKISRGHNLSKSVAASGAFGDSATGRHRSQFTWFNVKSDYKSPYGASTDESRRVTGRYQYDIERQALGVSAGWELLHERVDNTFITGQVFQPVPVTRLVSGLFVEARPSLGDRAQLTAGARLERIARSALEANPGSRPALADDVVWSLNPKIAAAFIVSPANAANWTKIRASAGTGIKPPTGFELAYTDNPSLKPERSRSVDAGVEQTLGRQSVVAEATWFYNRYDDLIVSVGRSYSSASRYKTDNIANAKSQGLETGLRWTGTHGLSARAGWTWLDTEVLGIDGADTAAPAPYKVGQPLVRRPRHQGFGELTWTDHCGSLFFNVGGRGQVADLEPNYASSLATNPGFATVSFGGSFIFARHLEVFGRVTNAFDKAYEDVFGYPALGRMATVGVRIAAGR